MSNNLDIRDLYVDIQKDVYTSLYAKEGEVNSRGLRIFLLNNGSVMDTEGMELHLYGKTKGGKVYKHKASPVSGANGVFQLLYPANMLKAGDIKAELRLTNGNYVVASKTFTITVDEAILSEDMIDGSNDPDFLSMLIDILDKIENGELKGEKGDPGEQGPPGQDGEDGSSLGSFSSNEIIDNYSNMETMQINASKSSSAGKLGWLINVGTEPDEVWLAIDMESLNGDWETDYLVDGAFVYAEVYYCGGGAYEVMVETKEIGEMYELELYPVMEGIVPILAQVNASEDSTASGSMSQVNSSRNSTASGNKSQVNASRLSTASGYRSQVNASFGSTTSGNKSQVNASSGSAASGDNSQVNASSGSSASGNNSQVNASSGSAARGDNSQVNASHNVVNEEFNSSAWGFAYSDPSTQNIKIHLLSESGDINHSGVLNSGHNFTDFAELFPNLTGKAQGYGLLQTIDGYGVRPANEGEQVIGVTSATAGVILGETPFSWVNRWVKDEWGAYVYHDIPDPDWEPDESKGETEDDRPMITVPKENPDYDPEREYVKRQERPDEWTVVGLIGQVYVRLKEDVEVMDYVKPWKDGVGQTSDEPTKLRVMKITQEFDKDKGYKIGFCLLS